ncbi:hypothetical protein [Algoriphagus boritolerans]|uniref:Uncharacterized protein n=1 Tax=Algoriphagus boritolerans DSM 17298 = JCM 18970 TaxID=1120964 RepID=A0A1H5RQK9_9BACT|nr:hypothetical protein [Algoriphagus boritolerans]SEF40636.1 hypothetical protein SAMN03080598_00056 [Algoriphagus boritolerans DSM 17298 = JCM 18970]
MKKLKSILTLTFALGFLAAVTFTSCGGKKEGAEETTEQAEGEHPAEGGEHPASDSTEHPANPDN